MIKMYPSTIDPHGKTWDYWAQEWWRWLLSIPDDRSPVHDHSGRFCDVDQPHTKEGVWFLAGTHSAKAERTCTIPEGMAIFFGAATCETSKLEFGDHLNQQQLLQLAKDGNQVQSLEVTVDNDKIDMKFLEVQGYHRSTSLFDVTLPDNNLWLWVPGGDTQAIADGYWVFLEPLSRGKHELMFKQETKDNPPTATVNCKYEVKYHLNVQ
jgi:hypothetical protein